MPIAVPTVLATSPAEFEQMMQRAQSVSSRVHVDICDGQFADNHTIGLAQVNPPERGDLDLHMMVMDPEGQFESAVSLKPALIIFHFESPGDLRKLIIDTQALGIKAGLAILPETPADVSAELIKTVDHVLVFTGRLGFNGGDMQTEQLAKIATVKKLNPQAEISVDGGVNDQVAAQAVKAGADVLYAGGYLQGSSDPTEAWRKLEAAL